MTPNPEPLVVLVTKRKLKVRRLGRVDYETGLTVQRETANAVRTATEPDTLLLLEHPHTLTIGRRGTGSSVLLSETALSDRGIKVFDTNRGGKVTYHGLGQIVGYPIINLSPHREDVHRYVRDLEEVLLRALRDFGIDAFCIKGLTGVHTTHGKLAAIGVHIARWITTHGFALNVNTDLSYFDLIVACDGEPVTSMHHLLGGPVDMDEVQDSLEYHFGEVFDLELTNKHLNHANSQSH
jgi:lipoyl(octanoyl) transferase